MILHFSGIDIVYLHLNHIGSVAIDINSCLHIDKLNYFNNSSPSSQSVHELSLCCTEFFSPLPHYLPCKRELMKERKNNSSETTAIALSKVKATKYKSFQWSICFLCGRSSLAYCGQILEELNF